MMPGTSTSQNNKLDTIITERTRTKCR